jgi:hypothetical protein
MNSCELYKLLRAELPLIPQLFGFGEGGFGFGCPSEGFENNTFVVPCLGKFGIQSDGLVISL